MAVFIVASSSSNLEDFDDPEALTLRGALAAAAEAEGDDIIRFAADVTRIDLHAVLTIDDAGAVTLEGDADGDHLPDVVLSGQFATRHLTITAQSVVTIEGIEFVEGYDDAGTGGDAAGSIYTEGDLTLRDVRFSYNEAHAGDGATGSTPSSKPATPPKAGDSVTATNGTTGYRGGTGGDGGDAGVVINKGVLALDTVVFDDTNVVLAGTGGKGGKGGTGGTGGEGGDSKGLYDPTKGGDGGRGGPGGFQGQHGEGAFGVLNLGGEVSGLAIVSDDQHATAQTAGLSAAAGGSGGSGGRGGVSWAFIRWGSGSQGPTGYTTTSSRGARLSDGLSGVEAGAVTQLDAWFTVTAEDGAEIREGQGYTFAIQRHSIDDGIYEVAWEVVPSVLTPEEDFDGPTSGTVAFSTTGGDIATVTVGLARDDRLEGAEQIAIRLTSARTLETEPREVGVSSTAAAVAVASELPTNGDDVIRGTSGSDNLLLRRGDDKAKGRGGDDVLKGQGGDDKLKGDAGDDDLHGDGGKDRLWGGAGDDALDGGKGNDRMWGGGGADVFHLSKGDGRDVIFDFKPGQDLIEIGRGAGRFGQLDIEQKGKDAIVSFRNVAVKLDDVDADDLSAADFLF